jgi:4-amino-4-deoxy-L-arabinose transferase-like glycosyltransferase
MSLKTERLLQLLLWCLGVLVLAWALYDARFRDAEGSLRGAVCLPFAVAAAAAVLGWAVPGPWRGSAGWLGLGLVGQAVALQLVDAGPTLRYQHYKPFSHLLVQSHPFLLLFLAGQTALVAAGVRRRWAVIGPWVRETFTAWRACAVGLVFALSSATVSRQVPAYLAELPLAAFVQSLNLATVVLVSWALPEETLVRLQRWFAVVFGPAGEARATRTRVDRFALVAAVWVATLAALLNTVSYQQHPHVPDEVTYLYHARYFAAGMLTMPAPPVPKAFDLNQMHFEPQRWYSIFSPGWPAALAAGVRLGVPWLINPLLAGLNVLGIYLLLWELYDRRLARIALLLLCASPWYVFMGMNFMSHTFALTWALVAALALVRCKRTGNAAWAGLSGVAAGALSLVRPLDGVIMAALLALWAVGAGGRRVTAWSLAAFIAGCVATSAANLPYNQLLTGDPTVFPVNAYFDKYYWLKSNALGFGPERGVGWPIDPFPGHGPLDALVNADLNIFSINIELFGWSTGSLILIALLAFSGRMRGSDHLMLAVIAAVFVAHFFYYFSGGPDFGARYWYLMIVPCAALAVRGMEFLESRIEGGRVLAAVLALCLCVLVNYFPWRAVDKYHHYLGMRPDVLQLARQHGFDGSLVLIRGERTPDYASAAVYNPIPLVPPDASLAVYTWDRNPEVRAQVLQAYPDRRVWIVAGPSLTGAGFRVVAGPLTAAEARAGGSFGSPQ